MRTLLLILRKFGIAVLTVFVVVTITFFLMRAIPGNVYSGERVLNETVIKNIRDKYHLDDSLSSQYFHWLKDVASLNFGISMFSEGRSVNDIIRTQAPISMFIGIITFILSFGVGITLGVFSAVSRESLFSRFTTFFAILGMALPNFVMAAILQYYFSVRIHLFPVLSTSSYIGFVLPVLALSIYPIAFITRTVYYSMIDVLRKEYIVAAKARGIPATRIIFIHALKNAILPLFSYLGPFLANILVGSFAIETIFNIPGLGRYYISSISNRDYTTIMGLTTFFALLLVSINLTIDVVNTLIDPRVTK